MSDTPRTDAAQKRMPLDNYHAFIQMGEFARQLERELSAMTQCALHEGVRSGKAVDELQDLRAAAQAHLDRYVALVNSGDAGHWNPEQEEHVINLRRALNP